MYCFIHTRGSEVIHGFHVLAAEVKISSNQQESNRSGYSARRTAVVFALDDVVSVHSSGFHGDTEVLHSPLQSRRVVAVERRRNLASTTDKINKRHADKCFPDTRNR